MLPPISPQPTPFTRDQVCRVRDDQFQQSREYIDRLVAECADKRASMIEAMVIPYLKATGLQITEIELVERHDAGKIVWYFRKKGSSD